jgi:hypothetical protein
LHNGDVHDRAVADRSGQFVMVPPRLPLGNYELRSRRPDGKEATSKQTVMVTLQSKKVASPMPLDKEDAGVASRQPDSTEATSKKGVVATLQPKTAPVGYAWRSWNCCSVRSASGHGCSLSRGDCSGTRRDDTRTLCPRDGRPFATVERTNTRFRTRRIARGHSEGSGDRLAIARVVLPQLRLHRVE